MKKLLVLLVFMTATNLSSFAGNSLKVKSSSITFKEFFAKPATASLVVDWSNAKYDNAKPAAEELGEDFDFVKKDCAAKFIEGFNTRSKNLKLTDDGKNTDYEFRLKVMNVDISVQVMVFGQHEAKMWGELSIIEKSSGNVLAVIEIEEAEDGADYVKKEAYGKTFQLLGYRLLKLRKK